MSSKKSKSQKGSIPQKKRNIRKKDYPLRYLTISEQYELKDVSEDRRDKVMEALVQEFPDKKGEIKGLISNIRSIEEHFHLWEKEKGIKEIRKILNKFNEIVHGQGIVETETLSRIEVARKRPLVPTLEEAIKVWEEKGNIPTLMWDHDRKKFDILWLSPMLEKDGLNGRPLPSHPPLPSGKEEEINELIKKIFDLEKTRYIHQEMVKGETRPLAEDFLRRLREINTDLKKGYSQLRIICPKCFEYIEKHNTW